MPARAVLPLAPCLLVACQPVGANLQDPSPAPLPRRVMLADVVAGVFAPSCSTRSCHGALGGQGGLVLEGEGLRARLVEATPSTKMAVDLGYGLVVPGRPDRSWLYLKMAGPPAGGGGVMPLGRAPDATQLALVRAWIAEGAEP